MRTNNFLLALFCVVATATVFARDATFEQELLSIQREWAAAKYQTDDSQVRRDAFAALVDRSAAFAEKYPSEVDAIAWDGIVLSTYAGAVSAFSAMKHAKAARQQLHRAESMDATALSGGVYASLGTLYFRVPGGIVGFGDDDLAEEYFRKALAVDSTNIDSNFLYGEFLADQGRFGDALMLLERALDAPPVAGRPVFDAGRRAEIRALIATVRSKLN
jgi:tetratricopeptide (TPR) repeat protein